MNSTRMMKGIHRPLAVLVAAASLLVSCSTRHLAPGNQSRTSLVEHLFSGYLNHPALQIADVGIFIQEPESRRILYRRNAHKLFLPASNQKLITTAAALYHLGPEYRYQTKVYTDGTIAEGVLRGNLYLRGSGDPTLSGRFHSGNVTGDLEAWTDSLQGLGVKVITGDIVADAHMFGDQRIHDSWAAGDLSYWYAAQISALSFNDNCLNVHISPGDSIGTPARLVYEPNTDYITMVNNLLTVHPDSVTSYDYHRHPATNQMRFSGQIAQSETVLEDWITVHNPAMYTATVFSELLSTSGITVEGVIREIGDSDSLPRYNAMRRLIMYESPPLSEIISVINQRSQNFYAEQVLKTMGYELYGHGTFEHGVRAVESYLSGVGVGVDNMNIADGSGLSRRNLISPYQIVAVLRDMYTGKYQKEYFASFPRTHTEGGTLTGRFRGTAAADHVAAKTGYIGFVRTLSGYVRTEDGQPLLFSIMVNDYTASTGLINDLQDSLIAVLASHTTEELLAQVKGR